MKFLNWNLYLKEDNVAPTPTQHYNFELDLNVKFS